MTTATTSVNVNVLRRLSYHYLSHGVASAAGMTLDNMRQFIAGTYHPTDEQLEALNRRINGHMYSKRAAR